jgi:hypothetical protein
MSSARIPRGYERNANLTREFLEVSEGQRPALAVRPAQYLPVKYQDHYLNDWVVITAGTIVAIDASGDLVNANGGASQTLTYTADDVGLPLLLILKVGIHTLPLQVLQALKFLVINL